MSSDRIRPEELIEHAAFLRRVASGILRRSDLADDAVQQTMLAALDRKPRRPSRLRAWLARIVRRKAIDILRHEVRLTRREERVAKDEAAPARPDSLETDRVRKTLARAVMDLDEPYRTTLLLRYYEGLGPTELAARQGAPVETVRTRLRRGLALLRERFTDGDGRLVHTMLLPLLVLWRTRPPMEKVSAHTTPATPDRPRATRVGVSRSRPAALRVAVTLLLAAGLAFVLLGTWDAGEKAGPLPDPPGAEESLSVATGTPPSGGSAGVAAPSTSVLPSPTAIPAAAALSGRVTEDGTDRPLGNAEVRVDIYRELPDGTTLKTRRARSDAYGRFAFPELPPGLGFLSVSATGFFMAHDRNVAPDGFFPGQSLTPDLVVWLDGESKGAVRDFGMRRGYRVTGVVLGPGREPVSGARVHSVKTTPDAVPYPWNRIPREIQAPGATTDEDGRFEMVGLPARGDWTFYAVKDGLRSGWSRSLVLGPGRPQGEVRLLLTAGGRLPGRVVGENGYGVAGARISVSGRTSVEYGGPATTESDERGRFSLTGLPADDALTLLVLADGWPRHTVPLGKLAEGQELPPLDVQLPAGETLKGSLLGSDGRPRAGVVLQLSRLPGTAGAVQATTAQDGTFTFHGLPRGRGRLAVLEEGWRAGRRLGPVDVPCPSLDLVYDPPRPASIRIVVKGPSGAPVPICRVRAKGRSDEGEVMERITERFVVGGEATFATVQGAVVDFRVFAASDANGRSLGLRTGVARATAGADESVTVRLEAGRCLVGHVRNEEGHGVPGAVLSLGEAMAVTDARGRFRVGAVPEGMQQLLVRPPRGFLGPSSIPIPVGDEPIEILVERGVSVAGQVHFADGALVRSGLVQAAWTSGSGERRQAQAVIRPNGCFLLAGVPPRTPLDLLVSAVGAAEHGCLTPWRTQEAAAETLDLRLPRGVLLEGRVVDSKDAPLAAGWIEAVRDHDRARGNVGRDGRFRIMVPTSGKWTLAVRPLVPGEKPWSVVVTAPAKDLLLAPPEADSEDGPK